MKTMSPPTSGAIGANTHTYHNRRNLYLKAMHADSFTCMYQVKFQVIYFVFLIFSGFSASGSVSTSGPPATDYQETQPLQDIQQEPVPPATPANYSPGISSDVKREQFLRCRQKTHPKDAVCPAPTAEAGSKTSEEKSKKKKDEKVSAADAEEEAWGADFKSKITSDFKIIYDMPCTIPQQ